MDEDRKLLEQAAKAAGYQVVWNEVWKCYQHVNPKPDKHGHFRHAWVPLDDDGDSQRLAVRMAFCVSHWPRHTPPDVMVGYSTGADSGANWTEEYGDDPDAATRRAVVCAAADSWKRAHGEAA